ncbi:hypothetical protein, partial [Klebsiella pneumoniae]|uniref:hypothetical protein n=1 Tax=Klebsiella pneumoniae TaxID=573 RepID=UPI001E3FD5D7
MGSCAAPSAKGDDKFITTDYLQQCPSDIALSGVACTSGVTPRQLVQSSSENDKSGLFKTVTKTIVFDTLI